MGFFSPGWKSSRPLTATSGPREELIGVRFRIRSRTTDRNGRVTIFSPGEPHCIPVSHARAMWRAGTLDLMDDEEPERRGWTRPDLENGHEVRVCRNGEMMMIG
jgi:hypothetical protein